ncbi:MAG: DUF4160 domain-containing protein [Candidatus Saccharicenans sp.]|nr:DUF4160 domain-containing protein [Candidatus Saccharicenans sp.]
MVAEFRGVRIEVFPREHMPPHFHVCYNSRHATYRIDNCELLEGSLGHREDKIVQYWYLKQGGKKAVEQAWKKTRPGDLQVGRYEGNIFDNRK